MTDHTHPPAEVSMLAVRVKPLVWLRHHRIEWMWQVQGCPYDIRCEGGIGYLVDYDSETLIGERGGPHNTFEAAKAAAQADYDALIMAAIEPAPDPRDAVIAGLVVALEKANQRLKRVPFNVAMEINAAIAAAKATP